MSGPFRRRHRRREFVQLSEAYQWERDEALRRAEVAEARADRMMDELVKARALRDGMARRLTIAIECDDLLSYYTPVGDEYERLARRVVMRLSGFSRDYRGDLRQTEAQRLLGV